MQSSPGARATFADLGVPKAMARSLADRGMEEPFPIQTATIPDLLAGRDLCGRAPTGSGKTLAFGIPLVAQVNDAGRARPKRPRGLVLVPTRELAAQVCKELQALAKPRGPWIESFYGGTAFPRQVNALRRGVDIAVACPGRLADLINQGCADLSDVSFVVLDEADRMADMGFLPEVRRLLDQCADKRQTILFSATLDGDVQVVIDRYMTNAARHELESDDDDLSRSTHLFWNVDAKSRLDTAAALVDRHGPSIVFCRTKRGADRVTRQLESAGVSAAAIHGDRSQAQRERALRSFHNGQVTALVATDVAARGIHVDGVQCVIHFDPPADHKDYVHRSGRTARAGATGVVVSLVMPPMKGAVTRLQRALELPTGLTTPDLTGSRQPAAGARPTTGATAVATDDARPAHRDRNPAADRGGERRTPRQGRPTDRDRTRSDRNGGDRGQARRDGRGRGREHEDRPRRPYDRRERPAAAADPDRRPSRRQGARIEGDWWPDDLVETSRFQRTDDPRPYDKRGPAKRAGATKRTSGTGANRADDRPGAPTGERRRPAAAGGPPRSKAANGRPARPARATSTNGKPGAAKRFNGKAGARTVPGRQGAGRRSGRG